MHTEKEEPLLILSLSFEFPWSFPKCGKQKVAWEIMHNEFFLSKKKNSKKSLSFGFVADVEDCRCCCFALLCDLDGFLNK